MNVKPLTRIERGLSWWAAFVQKRATLILLVALGLTLLLLYPASEFNLEWDDSNLLPSLPSEERIALIPQIGGAGVLFGVVEGGALADRKRFVDLWTQRLRDHDDRRLRDGEEAMLRLTYYKLPIRFFEDRRLLYLEKKDLLDIEARVNRRLEQEKKKSNPFYVDLEEEEEPEIDISFQDLAEKYNVDRFKEYSTSEDGAVLAVLFKPAQPAFDKAFSSRLTEWITGTGEAVLAQNRLSGVRFSLGGPYVEQLNERALLEQGILATQFTLLVGVSLLALMVFRRVRPLVLLGLAAIATGTWIRASLALFIGSVRLLPAFAVPISVGLGLGYGILFLYRYTEARRRDMEVEAAFEHAMVVNGRATILAALATIAAVLALGFSAFDDFRTFGFIAACGIGMTLVAMFGVLPALLITSERFSQMVPEAANVPAQLPARRMGRGKAIIALGILGILGGIAFIIQSYPCWQVTWCNTMNRCCTGRPCCKPRLDFEYNFRRLDVVDPARDATREKFQSAVPLPFDSVIIVAPDRAKLESFLEDVRISMDKPGSLIKGVASIFTFVPTEQEEKKAILERIDALATEKHIGFLESRARRKIDDVRPLLHPSEISLYQLPSGIVRAFTQEPAGTGHLLPILENALGRLSAEKLSNSEWYEAVWQTVGAMSEKEINGHLTGLSRTDFSAGQESAFLSWPMQEKREYLVSVLRTFHDRNIGTVAYLYPVMDPNFSYGSLKLSQEIEAIRARHKDIKITGKALDISRTLTKLRQTWHWVNFMALMAALAVLLVGVRKPLRAAVLLVPLVTVAFWLLFDMGLFRIRWNMYNIMALPVMIGISIDASLRVYLQYWEDGQVGAYRAIRLAGPSVQLMAVTVFLSLLGWIFMDQRGVASLGLLSMVGLALCTLAALTFLPAILERIHDAALAREVRRRKKAEKEAALQRKTRKL